MQCQPPSLSSPYRLLSSPNVSIRLGLRSKHGLNDYISRHEPEILTHLELVVNTVSMEEAVQQQAQTTEAAPEEAATGA